VTGVLIYGLIGLSVRIAIDYYTYSNKIEKDGGRVYIRKFTRRYDQDWILGIVIVCALAAGGNYLWIYWLGPTAVKLFGLDHMPPFADQIGIVFGLFSTWIGRQIAGLFGRKG
jgi:hypothetical protein